MKIILHSIRAKNFLQIGNEFETFNLEKSPFTAIVGANGSGKSTLLDMITFALYKKAYRPKQTLNQLINCTNKKNMLVEIAFSVGASNFVVRRGEKPKVFEIYKDKQLVKADPSIGDMQKHLEENIIQQTYKTFCQINVIGKATYKQFMELTPQDRRGVVEDILDSNIYSVMQSLAKSDLKNINEEMSDLGRDIQITSSKIDSTQQFLDKYNQDRTNQIVIFKSEIEEIKKEALALSQNIKKWTDDKQDLVDAQADMPSDVQSHIEELQSKIGGIASTTMKAKQVISKIDTLDKCPHCMQIVDKKHKEEIVEASRLEIKNNDVAENDFRDQLKSLQVIRTNRNDLQEKINSVSSMIIMANNKMETFKESVKYKLAQIKKLEEPISTDNLPNIDELKSALEVQNNTNDELVKKSTLLKQSIKLLGDDGIKAHLIAKYIPIINKSVNEYLERMGMFVEFNLDAEFNETISAINRSGFTYHSFSEGQKMRIDLAILLTWRKIAQIRNSMTTNVFFLDEIADGSLDQEGVDEFFRILKDVADAQNTFVISHSDSTIDLFDNVIKVKTIGNFSTYASE